jgi:hypothetical protein
LSTIRPPYPQPPPPQNQGQRLTGQSALFALARGKPAETAGAAAQPAVQSVSVNRAAEATAEKPEKILRPGSLLDIKI